MKRLLNPNFLVSVALMSSLVAAVIVGVAAAQGKVEQAIRQNFAAAGQLARIQVQGEKMRRYEKEMFIYAAVPASRTKYVKEFDEAHGKLLALLTEAAMPSAKAFTDEERKELQAWNEATTFYTSEFFKIAAAADAVTVASLTPEDRAGMTVRFNNDIKQGKDRFATVLNGAAKMREAKEQASMVINVEIDAVFRTLMLLVAGTAVVALVAAAFMFPRRQAMQGAQPTARSSRYSAATIG